MWPATGAYERAQKAGRMQSDTFPATDFFRGFLSQRLHLDSPVPLPLVDIHGRMNLSDPFFNSVSQLASATSMGS